MDMVHAWYEEDLQGGTLPFQATVANIGPGLLTAAAQWLESPVASPTVVERWIVSGKIVLAAQSTLLIPANGASSLSFVRRPGRRSVTFTGYAPTIDQNSAISPGAGAIAIAGRIPSLSLQTAIGVPAGSISLVGRTPSWANSIVAAPGAGSISVTGYAIVDQSTTGFLTPFYPTTLYSMRKRNASYSGPCIRVQNQTTDVETDIYFDSSGWCDEAALVSAASVTEILKVKTWYDQSGGGKDVTQATKLNQPLIMSSTFDVQHFQGKPVLKINAADQTLARSTDAAFGFGTAAWTVEIFARSSGLDGGAYNVLVDFRSGATATPHLLGVSQTPNSKIGYYNGTFYDGSGATVSNAVDYSFEWGYDGTNLHQFLDGSLARSDTLGVDNGSTKPITVGNTVDVGLSDFAGFIGEIAITKGTQRHSASFIPRNYLAGNGDTPIAVGTGGISLAGKTPSFVSNTPCAPGAGAITITPLAPTVS